MCAEENAQKRILMLEEYKAVMFSHPVTMRGKLTFVFKHLTNRNSFMSSSCNNHNTQVHLKKRKEKPVEGLNGLLQLFIFYSTDLNERSPSLGVEISSLRYFAEAKPRHALRRGADQIP